MLQRFPRRFNIFPQLPNRVSILRRFCSSESIEHQEEHEDGTYEAELFSRPHVQLRSKLFCPTQKLTKTKATHLKSTDLLEFAGYIRQSGSGLYSFLPLGVRVLETLTSIIDQHMHKIGGQKLQMPNLVPAELWKATGRWERMGPELIRVQDRSGHFYCLGPTHEESFTEVVGNCTLSPKILPLRLYQITPKFRDEIRPRHGLIRCREFLMKDMYSFDNSHATAMESYKKVYQAYQDFFNKIQLPVTIVQASSGNMGGSYSHEFQVLASVGDDQIITCPCGKNSWNVEMAKRKLPSICKNPPSVSQLMTLWNLKPNSLEEINSLPDQIFRGLNPNPKNHKILSTKFIVHLTSGSQKEPLEKYKRLFVYHHSGREVNMCSVSAVLGSSAQLLTSEEAKSVEVSGKPFFLF